MSFQFVLGIQAFLVYFIYLSSSWFIKFLERKNKDKFTVNLSAFSFLAVLWTVLPFIGICLVYFTSGRVLWWAMGASFGLFGAFLWFISKRIGSFNVAVALEKILFWLIAAVCLVTVIISLFIVIFLLLNSLKFFKFVSVFDFLFKLQWAPQMYKVFLADSFGVVPVIVGSVMIALVALMIACPIGVLCAVYLSEYSSKSVQQFSRPFLELLSSVPTVVYGYFAAFTFGPFFSHFAQHFGIDFSIESAFAAGVVIGIMTIPYIVSLVLDALKSMPKILKDSALSLGSTKSEAITRVILPYCLPSIFSAFSLAFSRAIGETMIVVMSAGLVANMTLNPFSSVTTATVQIVNLLTGDQEFSSPVTLSAFAIGFLLFVMTFCLNSATIIFANRWRKKMFS
jgi:phosphate transport system permease protein